MQSIVVKTGEGYDDWKIGDSFKRYKITSIEWVSNSCQDGVYLMSGSQKLALFPWHSIIRIDYVIAE